MNQTNKPKHVVVSIVDFAKAVKLLLSNYSVATSGDYVGEVNELVQHVVGALLGSNEYHEEFKKLTNYVYSTLASLDYKQAVDISNMLVAELSNAISNTTDAVDKKIITTIHYGRLKGHLLILDCDGDN